MIELPTKTPPEKIKKDHETIRNGILSVTLSWATLENHMAVLLETTIGHPKTRMGFVIYFTPNNAETRFEIVDRAVWALASQTTFDKRVEAAWKPIWLKLGRVRKTRNNITHGNITSVIRREITHTRLTPSVLDVDRMHNRPNPRQLPGLSPNDVSKAATHINELSQRISLFTDVIRAVQADSASTFRERVRELKDHQRC